MSRGLYFQLFSVHGLLRHDAMELGRDADTGGQIKYVVELAEALSRHEKVAQVDLFTRLIVDKRVSDDYSRQVEQISENMPDRPDPVRREKIHAEGASLAPFRRVHRQDHQVHQAGGPPPRHRPRTLRRCRLCGHHPLGVFRHSLHLHGPFPGTSKERSGC